MIPIKWDPFYESDVSNEYGLSIVGISPISDGEGMINGGAEVLDVGIYF